MMKLETIALYRYELPLVMPLPFKGGALQHRKGLLLRLMGENGREGWGEIAPLPHFSTETFEQAQKQALTLALRPRDFWNSFQFMEVVPSVRWGVEMALLNLHDSWQLKHPFVALNALLVGSRAQCITKAHEVVEKGYWAAKLKVGHRTLQEDIALVQDIASIFQDQCALRLDANRAWSWQDALQFAHAIKDVPIEYIEEPLVEASLLPYFVTETGMNVALDETLRENPSPIADDSLFAHTILKPMMDAKSAFAYFSESKKRILSSSVESGVGMLALLKMASCLNDAPIPMGFDTYQWLAEDVLEPRLDLSQPVVPLETFTLPDFRIRTELLEQLV